MGDYIERMLMEVILSWLLEYQRECDCLRHVTMRWDIEEHMQ